jgi:ceramide glucosyltransferase
MFVECALVAWSGVGLIWWLVALRLAMKAADVAVFPETAAPRISLSIFKPLPPLGAQGLRVVAEGIESFVAQLDADSEFLLGVHEVDRDFTGPFLKQLRISHPHARIKVIFRTEPDAVANPKIAGQQILAPHAEGDLWMWSDADIVAPPGFLQEIRTEFVRANAKMMTFPYVVRKIPTPPALLEALFVNADFYPGVLLLRDRGPVDFGLGAAMLFRRDDFLAEVGWDKIGSRLADDFYLGQKLKPVVIGRQTVETVSGAQTWTDALLHDLRWAKTIRWNRPGGAFSRILVLPVAGWLAAAAFAPFHYFAWIGLLGMIQADVAFAALMCDRVGCRLRGRMIFAMELWSLWRVLLWFSSWVPGPVTWGGKTWWYPRASQTVKSA